MSYAAPTFTEAVETLRHHVRGYRDPYAATKMTQAQALDNLADLLNSTFVRLVDLFVDEPGDSMLSDKKLRRLLNACAKKNGY